MRKATSSPKVPAEVVQIAPIAVAKEVINASEELLLNMFIELGSRRDCLAFSEAEVAQFDYGNPVFKTHTPEIGLFAWIIKSNTLNLDRSVPGTAVLKKC